MIKTFVNAWKVPELRKKMLFTILIVIIYRVGSAIPVPFVNIIDNIIQPDDATFLNYLSMIAGSAFGYGTIFAMGVTPYINSSIIIQLLTVAIPALEKLSKEGEEGRKKIAAITRYVTIGLALLQSTAYFIYLRTEGYIIKNDGANFTGFPMILQGITVVLCLTAGASLVMWLGEQVTDKGIGNGVSIILFAGIISRLPTTITALYQGFMQGGAYYAIVPVVAILLLAMVAYIVWMDNAERRVPVQYAKRVVGRKMYGGQSTHIPLKVNMSGVLPIIFAGSILSIFPTVQMFLSEEKKNAKIFEIFSQDHWVYAIIYFVLILFFAYFYASIQYDPREMSNNIRKNSGMIPGIRPGKPTSDYLAKIISRLVLLGALLLSVIALFPNVLTLFTKLIGSPMSLSIGGTSIIILVGVALETVKQLESQMMMRHYKGFLD
ncbi:MAG: preprotein translocase subunit SecY [Clostridia bacterium]|nr:preprotein translocase subunit SecY [Clostridia bacterium]